MRCDCIRIAAKSYAQVPLQTGTIAMELLKLAESGVRYGNREVVADAGVSFLCAMAAARGAALHVLVNLGHTDDEWAQSARDRVEKWLPQLDAIERDIWPILVAQLS